MHTGQVWSLTSIEVSEHLLRRTEMSVQHYKRCVVAQRKVKFFVSIAKGRLQIVRNFKVIKFQTFHIGIRELGNHWQHYIRRKRLRMSERKRNLSSLTPEIIHILCPQEKKINFSKVSLNVKLKSHQKRLHVVCITRQHPNCFIQS